MVVSVPALITEAAITSSILILEAIATLIRADTETSTKVRVRLRYTMALCLQFVRGKPFVLLNKGRNNQ